MAVNVVANWNNFGRRYRMASILRSTALAVLALCSLFSQAFGQSAASSSQQSSQPLWLLLLTSSLLSAAISGMIAGFFALRAKGKEYENEYFSEVMKKRITAYEHIEALIRMLKLTAVGEDKQPYHLLFAIEADKMTACQLAANISAEALWISDKAFKKSRDFSDLIYSLDDHPDGVIDFGKTHYRKIAVLREELERIVAKDLVDLHNVRKFLKSKSKRKAEGFREFRPL